MKPVYTGHQPHASIHIGLKIHTIFVGSVKCKNRCRRTVITLGRTLRFSYPASWRPSVGGQFSMSTVVSLACLRNICRMHRFHWGYSKINKRGNIVLFDCDIAFLTNNFCWLQVVYAVVTGPGEDGICNDSSAQCRDGHPSGFAPNRSILLCPYCYGGCNLPGSYSQAGSQSL